MLLTLLYVGFLGNRIFGVGPAGEPHWGVSAPDVAWVGGHVLLISRWEDCDVIMCITPIIREFWASSWAWNNSLDYYTTLLVRCFVRRESMTNGDPYITSWSCIYVSSGIVIYHHIISSYLTSGICNTNDRWLVRFVRLPLPPFPSHPHMILHLLVV